jgi:L-fucose mutarotase/ribose pyranase (RbsD/FucU family)
MYSNFRSKYSFNFACRVKHFFSQVPIWAKYQNICDAAAGTKVNFYKLDRYEFYERAKQVTIL